VETAVNVGEVSECSQGDVCRPTETISDHLSDPVGIHSMLYAAACLLSTVDFLIFATNNGKTKLFVTR